MPLTLRWFPPSWVLIRTSEAIAYIDPSYMRTYYRNHPSKIEFSTWPDPVDGLPEKLEPADLILLTHDHKDHAKDVTINRLRKKDTLVIGPERCRKNLGSWVSVIAPGESIICCDLRISAVPAYNTAAGNSTKKVHHKGHGVGYLLQTGGNTIYHAGDTDWIPEMKALGRVDVALLPIGGTYTMDVLEAVSAVAAIKPGTAIPIHHLKADPLQFKKLAKSIPGVRVAVPAIGEQLVIERLGQMDTNAST
jgi:L-ascorbate metabolism protein UlaG (beta-lactamase superfamily)